MKKLLGLLMVISLVTSCKSTKNNKVTIEPLKAPLEKNEEPVEQSKELVLPTYGIVIEQNGKWIQPSHGVVVLDKEEFNVIFNLPKPMAVLVHASFDDELFSQVSSGDQVAMREEFYASSAMAIALFNPDKNIFLSDDSSSPWYYENDQEHNFNKVEMKNGDYWCTRSIKNIWDTDDDESYDIKNVDLPIHLVFVPTISGENPTGAIKMNTTHLKIEWNN